jgi:hypothetical protein
MMLTTLPLTVAEPWPAVVEVCNVDAAETVPPVVAEPWEVVGVGDVVVVSGLGLGPVGLGLGPGLVVVAACAVVVGALAVVAAEATVVVPLAEAAANIDQYSAGGGVKGGGYTARLPFKASHCD